MAQWTTNWTFNSQKSQIPFFLLLYLKKVSLWTVSIDILKIICFGFWFVLFFSPSNGNCNRYTYNWSHFMWPRLVLRWSPRHHSSPWPEPSEWLAHISVLIYYWHKASYLQSWRELCILGILYILKAAGFFWLFLKNEPSKNNLVRILTCLFFFL